MCLMGVKIGRFNDKLESSFFERIDESKSSKMKKCDGKKNWTILIFASQQAV